MYRPVSVTAPNYSIHPLVGHHYRDRPRLVLRPRHLRSRIADKLRRRPDTTGKGTNVRKITGILATILLLPAVAFAQLRTWEASGTVGFVEINGSPSLFPFPVSVGDSYSFVITFDSAAEPDP